MSTKCKYGLRLITFTVGGGSSLQEFYGYIVPENLRKSQEMHGVEFILCTRTHVQSARILSFFWSVFSIFGLNTETYGVNLCFQFKYGKYEAEATPNSDTSRNGSFSARMNSANFSLMFLQYFNNPLGWSHENRTIY